jgi:hypothetical protein
MPIVKLTVLEAREKAIRVSVPDDPREFWLPIERVSPISPATGELELDRRAAFWSALRGGVEIYCELREWLRKRHRQLCDTSEFEETKAKLKSWKKKAAQC